MSEWFLSENGNEEDGFTWELLKKDGKKAILVAQCFDEQLGEELLDAAKWMEAFQSGMVSLNMGETPVDANTGKPWRRPADLKSYDIKFEKKPTRKPRT